MWSTRGGAMSRLGWGGHEIPRARGQTAARFGMTVLARGTPRWFTERNQRFLVASANDGLLAKDRETVMLKGAFYAFME